MVSLGSRVFPAQKNGPCANPNCDGIKVDDRIFYAKAEADTPQHFPGECRYTDELAAKRPMSACCSMEQLPNGTCPNGCDD